MIARRLALSCACLLGLVACSTPPAAPPPPPQAAVPPPPPPPPTRIRGAIAKLSDHTLTVVTREGPKVEVTLTEPLSVASVKPVNLASIKDNDFVGIASRPSPDGMREALEVLVFPESMRGRGEGDYAWDLQPGSMMTNATVSGAVRQKNGRDLTLMYKTGKVTIHVPPKTPVVTFGPADRKDLRPGRKVFIIASKDASGNLTAGRVTVAKDGVNPPM